MNYYELLGVNQNASQEEIKLAYKKQMKKWHPDINKSEDAINMSTKINEAKEVLLDDKKRRDYDEYLSKKINENYNRYTKIKATSNKEYTNNTVYEDKKVTKWQYLKDWLKFSSEKPFRKIVGLTFVILESFMCWIIKIILIITAFICNLGSYMIRTLFSYLAPIIGLLLLLFIGQCISGGFNEAIKENPIIINTFIVLFVLLISCLLLPILSKLILSPKTFDILYNKIDINLFKKAVGYKE